MARGDPLYTQDQEFDHNCQHDKRNRLGKRLITMKKSPFKDFFQKMGSKLSCSCGPLKIKGYRFDDPWTNNTRSRKDAHLLRLWAEVFHVTTGSGSVKWQQISEDLVPVNIACVSNNPQLVFHITAYNSQVDKILDVRLTQPGTRIGQASECFVYWKDPVRNDTWGLNFTSPIDAKQFKECCDGRRSDSMSRVRVKASSSRSTPISPSRSGGGGNGNGSAGSSNREPQCTCSHPTAPGTGGTPAAGGTAGTGGGCGTGQLTRQQRMLRESRSRGASNCSVNRVGTGDTNDHRGGADIGNRRIPPSASTQPPPQLTANGSAGHIAADSGGRSGTAERGGGKRKPLSTTAPSSPTKDNRKVQCTCITPEQFAYLHRYQHSGSRQELRSNSRGSREDLAGAGSQNMNNIYINQQGGENKENHHNHNQRNKNEAYPPQEKGGYRDEHANKGVYRDEHGSKGVYRDGLQEMQLMHHTSNRNNHQHHDNRDRFTRSHANFQNQPGWSQSCSRDSTGSLKTGDRDLAFTSDYNIKHKSELTKKYRSKSIDHLNDNQTKDFRFDTGTLKMGTLKAGTLRKALTQPSESPLTSPEMGKRDGKGGLVSGYYDSDVGFLSEPDMQDIWVPKYRDIGCQSTEDIGCQSSEQTLVHVPMDKQTKVKQKLYFDPQDGDTVVSPSSDNGGLFDNQFYATTPSSSNGGDSDFEGAESPTSRLLLEYEEHLWHTLEKGLDAESYSLHTFEAMLSQSCENLGETVDNAAGQGLCVNSNYNPDHHGTDHMLGGGGHGGGGPHRGRDHHLIGGGEGRGGQSRYLPQQHSLQLHQMGGSAGHRGLQLHPQHSLQPSYNHHSRQSSNGNQSREGSVILENDYSGGGRKSCHRDNGSNMELQRNNSFGSQRSMQDTGYFSDRNECGMGIVQSSRSNNGGAVITGSGYLSDPAARNKAGEGGLARSGYMSDQEGRTCRYKIDARNRNTTIDFRNRSATIDSRDVSRKSCQPQETIRSGYMSDQEGRNRYKRGDVIIDPTSSRVKPSQQESIGSGYTSDQETKGVLYTNANSAHRNKSPCHQAENTRSSSGYMSDHDLRGNQCCCNNQRSAGTTRISRTCSYDRDTAGSAARHVRGMSKSSETVAGLHHHQLSVDAGVSGSGITAGGASGNSGSNSEVRVCRLGYLILSDENESS